MKIDQSGYMIVLTLMIISLSVFLVTYMVSRGSVYISFAQSVVYREQAKVLVLGITQLTISQLQAPGLKEEKKEKETHDDKQKLKTVDLWQKKMIEQFFPLLNQWQSFALEEQIEGVTAHLSFCVSSEDGKININALYDFKEKKFKDNFRMFLQYIFEKIEKITGTKNMLSALEQFLKKRTMPLEDITELLLIPEFSWFKTRVFFEPFKPQNAEEKNGDSLYLSDIFTTWSKDPLIEPWMLSSSLQILLGLKLEHDVEKRKEMIEKQLSQFKIKTVWTTEWNKVLNTIYGVSWQDLPGVVHTMLKTLFEPKVFLVRMKARVNEYEQSLVAFFERVTSTSQDDRYQFHVKLRKLYWI